MSVMQDLTGHLTRHSIVEVIRNIYLDGRTGTLEIEHEDKKRRFYFVSGELHLPGSHGLAQRLGELLQVERRLRASEEDSRDDLDVPALEGSVDADVFARQRALEAVQNPEDRAKAAEHLKVLVERIVDVLVEWEHGSYEFDGDLRRLPVDLVGPLPTAYLVMEGSVRGLTDEELIERMGGEEALLVANRDSELLGNLHAFDPGEMFLLSRADSPITLKELLRQVPGERMATLIMLNRLRAVDLLEVASSEETPVGTATGSVQLIDSMVERFLQRIGNELESNPATIDSEEHRSKVANLIVKVGSMTHYELLEIGYHDTDKQVHEAYQELARQLHPRHASALGLGGREGALRLLFERATVAYLTLSDPVRRAEYNQAAGIDASRLPSTRQRADEQRKVAEENYRRALELVEQEDFHFALELTRQSIRADPRAEYFALLGFIQRRNPHWLEQAAESYRQAIKRDAQNPEYRVALGQLMESLGEPHSARVHYSAALQVAPDMEEAIDGMQRVQERRLLSNVVGSKGAADGRGGLMAKIRGLFRRG